MEDQTEADPIDLYADKVAAIVASAEKEIRTPAEAIETIGRVVGEYLANIPAEPPEVELVIEHAREAIGQVAGDPKVSDPVMAEYGDEVLKSVRISPQIQAQFEMMLERLDVAIRLGDAGSVDELAQLCRQGRHSHRHLISLPGAGHRIVELAHDLGQPECLAIAVRPLPDAAARLGHHYWWRGEFLHALDLLAHLAAEPGSDVGTRARHELLDLVGYVDTSGEAAVRLPVHLLDDDDRARLLAAHESRVELFSADPLQVPLHHTILRDNRIVRSTLWQANDARQL